MNIYEQALHSHTPAPQGCPTYIPWFAKGEYARRHGTTWTFPDGTMVRGGEIVKRGHGRLVGADPVSKPQPTPEKRSETPRKASEIPPKTIRTSDQAQVLWSQCNGRTERAALLSRHGIDPTIMDNAPNPGVASMRGLNALRRVLG
jgi:hypothetical protein